MRRFWPEARPSEIEQALQQDFSAHTELARKQRLAVAHIRAEEQCEAQMDTRAQAAGADTQRWLYSTEALCWLHGQLFQDLGREDLRLADGSLLQAGVLRHRSVAVGRHEAPVAPAVPAFLDRWAQVYGGA